MKRQAESKRPKGWGTVAHVEVVNGSAFEKEFPSSGQKPLVSIKKMFIVVPPCRHEKWRFVA